jgi:hypothetical protein
LATLAMGTGWLAPGPGRTPMPLMPAAETPDAGHVMVPSGPLRGVTGLGCAVPGRGGDVADDDAD